LFYVLWLLAADILNEHDGDDDDDGDEYHMQVRVNAATDAARRPTSTSAIPSLHSASECHSADDHDAETRPRRGRKRLPETVGDWNWLYR